MGFSSVKRKANGMILSWKSPLVTPIRSANCGQCSLENSHGSKMISDVTKVGNA